MGRSIPIIACLAALGHVLAVALYPFSARFLDSENVAIIGLMDANIMLVVGWLGFGLSATATRDIALSGDWKKIISSTQSARLTLSLVFMVIGVVGLNVFDGNRYFWLALVAAPFLAVNYDYLLYGLGRPVSASVVSFLRQSIPLIIFCLLLFLGVADSDYYMPLIIVFAVLSAYAVSVLVKSPFLYKLDPFFVKIYWASASIGIAGLVLGMQRYGFINMLEEHLTSSEIVQLLVSLKCMLFVVACKRMLIQIFYTKLLDDLVAFKINIFCMASAIATIGTCWIFPDFLSSILFDSQDAADILRVMSLGVFSVLFFAVSDSKLLLIRKDRWMSISTVLTGLVFVSIIFSFRNELRLVDIVGLMVFFEFVLSFAYWVGLVYYKKTILKGGV